MDEPEPSPETEPIAPTQFPPWVKRLAFIAAYMMPMFVLWAVVGYPDDFGIHLDPGKAGAFESWWYTYLLLEHPSVLNLILFGYMWAPILALIAWLAHKFWPAGGIKLRMFADEEEGTNEPPC